MRRRHSDQPALITDLPPNPEAEFEHRRRRYALMMALRAVCVIAATLTYRLSIVLALVFIAGGAVLPWCAVILANDGPPKSKRRPVYHGDNGQRSLPGPPDRPTIDS